MKYLKDRIGEEILGFIPIIDKQIFQVLVLHGVEEGGIWVESENLTQMMLSSLKQAGSSKTPIFFLPFHQIGFLIDSSTKVSLSNKAFGL